MRRSHGGDYEGFGARVAQARQVRGLSQQEASDLLGMPQSTYAGYESGSRKVPLSVIKQFSQFFGVSTDYLVSGHPEPIAAHFDGEEFTPEERKEIERFIRYVKSRRQE